MLPIDLADLPEREIVPGFHARFIHSQNMTLAYWRIEAGAALPEHAHPHEQVLNLLEGEFEAVVEGQTTRLLPGMVSIIPGGVRHAGKALTPCRILDVFYPVREEYRSA